MRIGIDLGGTKIEGIALDLRGNEVRRLRIPTPRDDYAATVSHIAQLVRQIEADIGQTATVGVGIPGTIVAKTGLVKNANSIWLNGQPLERDLSNTLNREVRCANDANCFTISEATDGAAAGYSVVFGVIIGTGCGGGLSLHGRLHAGQNGIAGEWGHMPLPWPTAEEAPGPPCYCGRNGCLETWVSGTGFERDYREQSGQAVSGHDIVRRAMNGENQAIEALRHLQNRLARGLALVVDLIDPDAIVLGGGLSNLDALYTKAFEASLAKHTFGGGTQTPVLRNQHGDSSGVRGAAWLWSPEHNTEVHPSPSGL